MSKAKGTVEGTLYGFRATRFEDGVSKHFIVHPQQEEPYKQAVDRTYVTDPSLREAKP